MAEVSSFFTSGRDKKRADHIHIVAFDRSIGYWFLFALDMRVMTEDNRIHPSVKFTYVYNDRLLCLWLKMCLEEVFLKEKRHTLLFFQTKE